MTHNDDKDIKKFISENVEKPEIKLTSQQIIARFNERQVTKPVKRSIFAMPQFKLGLGFLTIALLVGTTVYLTRDVIVPPVISSEDPPILVKEGNKIPGGKEGEFLFMSSSAIVYAPSESVAITPQISARLDFSPTAAIDNQVELEATLDQTLPLVTDYYESTRGFNFQKNQGSYNGTYGTYTREYIINENTRLIANVELEVDDTETETEIDGEIIMNDKTYRFEGETEVDITDNETDISLKIYYTENSYLEINSENEGNEQTFKYKLTLDGNEAFYAEMESYNMKGNTTRFIDTNVKRNNIDYYFHIERRMSHFVVYYNNYMITATLGTDHKFTYDYKLK